MLDELFHTIPHFFTEKRTMPMSDVEVQAMEMAGRKVSLRRKQPQVVLEKF